MLNDHIRRCAHIKTNGTQCGAPAARGNQFCHFHWRASKDFPRRRALAPKPIPAMVIDLTLIDDPDGIHYAIMQVIQGMLNGQLEDKRAGRVLYALQIMSTNFKQTTFQRQLEDEYRKSNLNAYELWDKYAKIREDEERTELHEKRVEEIKRLEKTCCKCRAVVDEKDLMPATPSSTTPTPDSSNTATSPDNTAPTIQACASTLTFRPSITQSTDHKITRSLQSVTPLNFFSSSVIQRSRGEGGKASRKHLS